MKYEEMFAFTVTEVKECLEYIGKTYKVFQREDKVEFLLKFTDRVICNVTVDRGDENIPDAMLSTMVTGFSDDSMTVEPYSYEESVVESGDVNRMVGEMFTEAERYDIFLQRCERLLRKMDKLCKEYGVDMNVIVTIENLDIHI